MCVTYSKITRKRLPALSIKLWIIICCITLPYPANATALQNNGKKECYSAGWPSNYCQLSPDPDLVRGILANGLRYVIQRNNEPQSRVALYLNVHTGAFYENNQQRGTAHFLEHMMFKGSRNFAPGRLIQYFQSIGMNFGGDINAHTTNEETTYHLILPSTSHNALHTGLQVFRDFLDGALLSPEEVEKERNVILAEKRARDSAAYRTMVKNAQFSFEGTRLADRFIIGTEATLYNLDSTRLQTFYQNWYRPENVDLVIVGDIDPQQTIPLIKEYFSSSKGKGKRPDCPHFGLLKKRGTWAFYHFEPELGKTNISIEVLWDTPLEHDSKLLRRRNLVKYIASAILQYRIDEIIEQGDSPLLSASYVHSLLAGRIGFAAIDGQTTKEDWKKGIAALQEILQQVQTYGVSQKELDRIKKIIRSNLQQAVSTRNSRDSRAIAQEILSSLNRDRVYQSPEQELSLYSPLLNTITTKEISEMLQRTWEKGLHIISVTGDAELKGDPANSIKHVYTQSLAKQAAPYAPAETASFPYLPLNNKTVTVEKREFFKKIGVEKITLSNGIIVNLKKTDFVENSFLLAASFGTGLLDEPAQGMGLISDEVINKSGTARLTLSQLEELFADSSFSSSFHIQKDSFIYMGGGLEKDLDLYLQFLQHRIFDPGFRPEVFTLTKSRFDQMYRRLTRQIEGAISLKVSPFLADNHPKFGLPPKEAIDRYHFSDYANWVKTIFQPSSLEFSIVGQFNKDNVLTAIVNYFGEGEYQQPKRKKEPPIHFPIGEELHIEVNTDVQKSIVAVAWPTADIWNKKQDRQLKVLAEVLNEQLRVHLRDKLGAAYSPFAYRTSSQLYKDYGFIYVQATVEPNREQELIKAILEVAQQIQDTGVTSSELQKALEPIQTELHEITRTNSYWLGVLLNSSRYPEQYTWAETVEKDYTEITPTKIGTLAKQFLSQENAARIIIQPAARSFSLSR